VAGLEVELDVAALGDADGGVERVAVVREQRAHLGLGLEVELGRLELHPVHVAQHRLGLEAQEAVVHERVVARGEVDVVGDDGAEPDLLGEPGEHGHRARLVVDAVVLELDEHVLVAEQLLEELEHGLGLVVAFGEHERGDLALEARREADEAVVVLGQALLVDPRPVVKALEVADRGELEQVAVAGVVLGEQHEVVAGLPDAAGALDRAALGRDVRLDADDRLDLRLAAGLVELDGAVQVAVVGERHGRHLLLGRAPCELGEAACAVEQAVLAVVVQMDKHRRRIPRQYLNARACSAGQTGSPAARAASRRV